MGLLKRTTVFIGWLSGSVAGLGALLYASGYLVTRAHLHLLGLDRLLVPGQERFIEEGANFFLVTGQVLIHDLLSLVALAVAIALIGLVVYALLWLCGFPGARATRSGIDRCWAAVGKLHARLPWSPDISAYVALLLLLYVHLLSYLDKFLAPLDLSNLLYEGVSNPATATSMRAQLQRWLLDDDSRRLAGHFADLLLGELEAILFVALAWWITRARVRRPLMVAPFLVVLVLYTAYLPRLFGVLVHSTTYNRIVLRGDGPGASADCLFLLHKTSDEFVVWNAASRTVVWVPKTHLQRAEIRQGRPLFSKGNACD
jgi:hypothetical protein